MKFVRGLFVFLLNIILLVLIIGLSFVIRTKSFLEKELAYPLIRETVLAGITNQEITEEQKELIEKIMEDKDFEHIVDRAIQNFINYETNDEYDLSKKDYDTAINYILKYREEINKLDNTKYTEKEIKELLKYDDANMIIKEAFKNLDIESDENALKTFVGIYKQVTSTETNMILIGTIIGVILLIMLVSWSLITWMLVTGIDLILSGGLFAIIYSLGSEFLANAVPTAESISIDMVKAINLNGFLIMAVIEVVVGILLIVIYGILKKGNEEATVINQTQ